MGRGLKWVDGQEMSTKNSWQVSQLHYYTLMEIIDLSFKYSNLNFIAIALGLYGKDWQKV